MNAKGNPQKKFNKESSFAMIPKIMSGATCTKSNDNILLNPVNIFVKSEEEMLVSSNKTVQSNTYKNKEISDSTIQSSVDQIGLCDTSILYKNNTSNTETRDLKSDLESHQSNTDSNKISNNDDTSLKVKEIIAYPELNPISQKEMTNEQKPAKSIIVHSAQAKKRGRPRKYVCIQTPEEYDNYYSHLHVSNLETSTYRTKNSTNTFVAASDSKSSNENIKIDISDNITTPKRRGRPPSKNKNSIKNEVKDRIKKKVTINTPDTEHIPQLSDTVVVSKENSRLNVVEKEEIQLIKCMRCEKEIAKEQQEVHNLMKHNNMGWYEGEESMDFQNDIKLLKRVLSNAIKRKKGQLGCEQCGAIKRSVNGFISHIQFCGKSDDEKRALMVTCSVCNAVMMPSSMEIHERHHRELKYNKRKSFLMEFPENEKVRRKAAEKAVSKILQFTELVKDECLGQPKKVELNSSVLAEEIAPNTSTKCEDILDDTNGTSNVTGISCQESKSFETEPHPMKMIKPKSEDDSFSKIESTLPVTEDQYDTFGSYVASEIRCLNSDYLRRKLKRKIQCAIIDIQDEEDRLPGSTTPESSFT
uniref:Uncharacterized protein n=1 Tax=Vespula pensylvanica TaxID=30213 RepID=A0A834NYH7_VESPE|nr:hypothetical protein H0235_009272 [Vespula pensylvanica]